MSTPALNLTKPRSPGQQMAASTGYCAYVDVDFFVSIQRRRDGEHAGQYRLALVSAHRADELAHALSCASPDLYAVMDDFGDLKLVGCPQ